MSNGYKLLKVKKAGKIPGVKIGPESMVDLRYIQEILGHKNPKTTEIYTHVSKASLTSIKNPLDLIFKGETRRTVVRNRL